MSALTPPHPRRPGIDLVAEHKAKVRVPWRMRLYAWLVGRQG